VKHTCVVDENVDALELVTYAVYHLFDGAGIVEVTVVDERLLAVRLDIVGDRLCALFVAIVVDDNVVVFSEFTCVALPIPPLAPVTSAVGVIVPISSTDYNKRSSSAERLHLSIRMRSPIYCSDGASPSSPSSWGL